MLYEEDYFDGEKVTVSDNITSKEYSIASMEAFEIYAQNHDRHGGNWGVLVKNSNIKKFIE